MSEVKRYDPDTRGKMQEWDDGDYVDWIAFDALRAKADQLAVALEGVMEWASHVAGDNQDPEAADRELDADRRARAALAAYRT